MLSTGGSDGPDEPVASSPRESRRLLKMQGGHTPQEAVGRAAARHSSDGRLPAGQGLVQVQRRERWVEEHRFTSTAAEAARGRAVTSPSLSRNGRAALAYAAKGWPVFPLVRQEATLPTRSARLTVGHGGPGDHHPVVDAAPQRQRRRRRPTEGFGARCGRPGGLGLDPWRRPRPARHADPGDRPWRGLAHLRFTWPSVDGSQRGRHTPSRLDRGRLGGYVVVAPSVTVGPYRWNGDGTPDLRPSAPRLSGWSSRSARACRTSSRPGPLRRMGSNHRGADSRGRAQRHPGEGRRTVLLPPAGRRRMRPGRALGGSPPGATPRRGRGTAHDRIYRNGRAQAPWG